MNGELVSIGSELLLGHIVDSNSAFLARELNALGVGVRYGSVVGDNPERMQEVLARALDRSDIVITSGGLGPTEDDLTREIVAKVLGVELEFHQHLYDHIKQLFEGIGRAMTENNARQAYVPTGSEVIPNPQGTAPAFMAETAAGHRIFCLPGVPRELEWLMHKAVAPRIEALTAGIIKSRTLLICGEGESRVDMKVGDLLREATNPTLGILAHQFITALRITARADGEPEADALIGGMEADIRQRFGKLIFGVDDQTIEAVVCDLLIQYDATVAVAETITGGAIARRFVSAGRPCFLGGAVLPSSGAIETFLGAPPAVEGPEPVAAALAVRAREVYGAAIGIGVATAGAATAANDTAFGGGETAMALALPDDTPQTRTVPFSGRTAVQQDRLAVVVLEFLRRTLVGAAVA